ncbi:MAG: C40 family peptidase [Gammaproteobacteria bacterium]
MIIRLGSKVVVSHYAMLRLLLLRTMSTRTRRLVVLALLLHGIVACAAARWENTDSPVRVVSKPNAESSVQQMPVQPTLTRGNQLIDVYNDWKGTPYRFGGTTRNGIDCSAFTQQAMNRAYGVLLPRTTAQQRSQGVAVTPDSVRSGDLVFFKTGETLNHVGVMMGARRFMHASTSSGVTISRVDDAYWKSKVIGYRRVTP